MEGHLHCEIGQSLGCALKPFIPLLAASVSALVLASTAQSNPTATPLIVGNFSGGVVFYTNDGSIRETQFARLSVKTVTPTRTVVSVQWNFSVVPWNVAPVCVHHLSSMRVIRKGVEFAYRVSSMTGQCIPKAKSYRIFALDRRRVTIQLTYGDGLTAAGLLFRK